MPLTLGASYMRQAFDNSGTFVQNAKRALSRVDFDTMIGTGLSGSLAIPVLARAMNKHWAIVRKDNDGSHSSCIIEGSIGNRWVFVDDFISSGATRDRVIRVVTETVQEYDPGMDLEHVGTYCYHLDGYTGAAQYMV